MINLVYFLLAISITFTSMVLGVAINAFLRKKEFYKNISNLNFIKGDLIYQIMGVNLFRWLVSKTFWKYINPHFIIKKRPDLAKLIFIRNEMSNAEISHLAGFIIVTFVSGIIFITNKLEFGIMLMLFNILFNLYPALLQQKNKGRISNLIKSMEY